MIEHEGLSGPVNLAAPNPVPNTEFMRTLRSAWGKRLGLPAPEFREMNEFVVTFRAAPALQPRQGQAQYQGTLWKEEEPPPSLTTESEPGNLEGRLVKAVGYVNDHGSITNKIYRNLTGVSERTARRDLEVLEERGRLKAL